MPLFASLIANLTFLLIWGLFLQPTSAAAHTSAPSNALPTQTLQREPNNPRAFEPEDNGNPEDSSGAGGRFVSHGSTPFE